MTHSNSHRGCRGSSSTEERNADRKAERLVKFQDAAWSNGCPICGNEEASSMDHCEECGTPNPTLETDL